MQRPTSVFGLTRHLVRTRWEKLTPRGKTLSVVAAVLFGAAALVGARSLACCSSGCPYQQQMQADSVDSAAASADHGGCPHSRR
ncbi:MAG: hypothetical protein H6721_06435 [Sandaracinus sp.]|nr:hypothetical protein [Sandaracinus sp.]MCB9612738.1 hypothetical protein [Sandaracinus sp.]MCB9631759.1 hypothetical protein [Sandaracinus sp.]